MTSLRNTTVALLLTTAIVAVGCGIPGRGGDDPVDERGADAGSADESSEEEFPLDDEVFPIDATFWHAGFEVALSDAILFTVEDEFSGQLSRMLGLEASVTNLGPRPAWWNSQTVIVTSTANYQIDVPEIPEVPGGLTSTGRFVTRVDPDIDLTDAYLQVGREGNQQARVPLGPDGGELVDLAPWEVTLSGTASMERIDLSFTLAEIRADIPARHDQVAAGQLALTLHFDVVSRYTRAGGAFIGHDFFSIIMPDGSAIGADDLVNPAGVIYGDPDGLDHPGFEARFVIREPATGEYTVRFRPRGAAADWGGDGPDEATFTFTL
jgi:hypothetical protein